MPGRNFIMKLAKLVIAAAWTDGAIAPEETNALKDLLFGLGELTGKQWAELEMYLDHPVGDDERQRLMDEVLASIHGARDKALVMDTMRALVEADGVVTQEEQALLSDMKRAVDRQPSGLLGTLGRMVHGAVDKRSIAQSAREEHFTDFIHNRIYFRLVAGGRNQAIDLPEEKLRKLCLAAGLMAQVAWVDEDMSEDEKDAITRALVARWGLRQSEAEAVARICTSPEARDIDYQRLSRSFYESTDLDERKSFITCLFEIANASGKTSNDEIEEIRRIASSLKVPHADFINAKLAISKEDRGGL